MRRASSEAPGAEKQWHGPGLWRRVGNVMTGLLARVGIGPVYLLTTRGRKTGQSHTNPVVRQHLGSDGFLPPTEPSHGCTTPAPPGRISLRHGRNTRDYAIREVSPSERGPVLKRYVAIAAISRPYFRAGKDSPVDDFVAEADRRPRISGFTPLAEAVS